MNEETQELSHTVACGASATRAAVLTVYHDGACPLCRREIGFFRRRDAAGAIEWVDVSAGSAEIIAPDLRRSDALARFHVRLPDGRLCSGASGFAAMWSVVPGYRWLGRFARSPAVHPVLELAYRGFLPIRPLFQRIARVLEQITRRA